MEVAGGVKDGLNLMMAKTIRPMTTIPPMIPPTTPPTMALVLALSPVSFAG